MDMNLTSSTNQPTMPLQYLFKDQVARKHSLGKHCNRAKDGATYKQPLSTGAGTGTGNAASGGLGIGTSSGVSIGAGSGSLATNVAAVNAIASAQALSRSRQDTQLILQTDVVDTISKQPLQVSFATGASVGLSIQRAKMLAK